ncbi:hypothetical protein DFP73DRAFT_484520, partial [Morchella snyderi]
QIAMFMKIVGENVSNCAVQEKFQHSGDIVHRHFYNAINTLLKLHKEHVTPHLPLHHHKSVIMKSYFPPFKNVLKQQLVPIFRVSTKY